MNYGVEFVTEYRGQDGNVHVTDASMILTRDDNPAECHICVMSHYSNKCPDGGKSDTQVKKDANTGTSSTSPYTHDKE